MLHMADRAGNLPRVARQRQMFGPHAKPVACQPQRPARQKIHLRTADEACHKDIVRVVIQPHGRADLLDPPGAQHHNAMRQRHCLDLIMRHIDCRGAQLAVKPRNFYARGHPQGGIQV